MKRYIASALAFSMALSMSANAFAAGNSQFFKDVTVDNYGWAVEYVDYIAKNGIASGVGSDMYAPGNNIERGDFAILVDKTFDFKGGNLKNFALNDVSEDSYYAQAIADCAAQKVITERGAYYPEDYIKRIDAIKMIYRALNVTNRISAPSMDLSMFNDSNAISGAEAQASVATLYSIGLIKGDDKQNLNPDSTMTRAEMAVVFAQLDKYIDKYDAEAKEKADKKAEEDKVKEQQKQEQKKEENKVDESGVISSKTVNDQVKLSNGGNITIEDSNVVVSNEDAVMLSNDSKADISKTSISSKGANAINVANKAKADVNGGSITATDGVAVNASDEAEITLKNTNVVAKGENANYAISVSDSAKVKATDLDIDAGNNSGAIQMSSGGTLELDSVNITAKTGSGKATNSGAIDITSADDKVCTIDLNNVTINNPTGAAFYTNGGSAVININEGCKFNTAALITPPPNNYKNAQKTPSHITINVAEGIDLSDARILADSKTEITLNLAANTTFRGQLDPEQEGYINLSIDYLTTTLELNDDLYLDRFDTDKTLVFDNIFDNGFDIYYNDSNPDNDWLEARTYDLPSGGRLIPYTKYPME